MYFKDARSIFYYSNRSIRDTNLRKIVFFVIKILLPKNNLPPAPQEEASRLRKDGIIVWDQLVDATTVNNIRQYLSTKSVYDLQDFIDGKGQIPLKLEDVKITRQKKLKYFDADIAGCKDIIDIANSPKILSLVADYFGCKPTIGNMAAWWTKAGADPAEKFYDDMFHRDVDDIKFLKLFVYLNDVGPKNGAHSFIKGSHISNECTARRMLSDEEIDRHFPKNNQLVLTGKSGGAFLEDTWGLHRSMPCEEGERLVLHIMYCVTSLNKHFPPKPVAENVYGVDGYVNRVYLG